MAPVTIIVAVLVLLSSIITVTSQLIKQFHYTGIVQTFTVPSTITHINIELAGASGGDFGGIVGGAGAIVHANYVPVAPQETLYIYVGGAATSNEQGGTFGGYNGGGAAGHWFGTSGGGATDGKDILMY